MLNDFDNTLGMVPIECEQGVGCWYSGAGGSVLPGGGGSYTHFPVGNYSPFTPVGDGSPIPSQSTQPAQTAGGQASSPTPSLGQPPTAAQTQQIIAGVDNTTLLLIGGAVGLILLLR